MRLAEEIGSYEIAKSMPEFCGVISKSPTVKARKQVIEAEEANFDFAVLERAIESAIYQDIKQLADSGQGGDVILPKTVTSAGAGQVVIDIRAPDDVESSPLPMADVLAIPFYKLASAFDAMEKSKSYLLYCDQGVMSGMQAAALLVKGYDVAVLKR